MSVVVEGLSVIKARATLPNAARGRRMPWRQGEVHEVDHVSAYRANPASDAPRTDERTTRGVGRARSEAMSDATLLDRVRAEVGEAHFARYFDGQARIDVGEHGVEVTVGSDILARLIERRFGEQLRRAVRARDQRGDASTSSGGTGDGATPCAEVSVKVSKELRAEGPTAAPSPAERPAPTPAKRPTVHGIRHSLGQFLVGISNRLAFSAAERMGAGDLTGSLFIHGPCGVGKTHLLQGLAARYLERHPGAAVRCLSAEAFTNEYIAAVRANKIDAFRKAYRKLDLLCIDDVHFVAGKEGTQMELLHTFDAIGLEGARVALASDAHPKEIAKLNAKLASRFMAGALARIDAPDPDLRARLVRTLAERRGLILEDAAAALIMERCSRSLAPGQGVSVREIDGVLIQIEAVSRLLPEFATPDGRVGVVLVRRALGLVDSDRFAGSETRARRPIPIEAIMGEVCRALAVDVSELMGRGRHKRVVLARAICSHLARKLTTLSFPEIARGMGRPNHSTIITAYKRLEQQMGVEDGGRLERDVAMGLSAELRSLSVRELTRTLHDRAAAL